MKFSQIDNPTTLSINWRKTKRYQGDHIILNPTKSAVTLLQSKNLPINVFKEIREPWFYINKIHSPPVSYTLLLSHGVGKIPLCLSMHGLERPGFLSTMMFKTRKHRNQKGRKSTKVPDCWFREDCGAFRFPYWHFVIQKHSIVKKVDNWSSEYWSTKVVWGCQEARRADQAIDDRRDDSEDVGGSKCTRNADIPVVKLLLPGVEQGTFPYRRFKKLYNEFLARLHFVILFYAAPR